MISEAGFRHVYGPVSSRRLGRSLGIDLVPFKTCTYDCVYCQLGRTTNKTIERQEYVSVDEVLDELERKLAGEPVAEYVTLAGSGEPTLNARIGDLLGKIKSLTPTPVAVLTNGSLLWMREVREALMGADLVLPSLDAGDERSFQYVNRPHGGITFEQMFAGLAQFTEHFPGSVWLEVFLLTGVTGIRSEVEKIAALTRRIGPERVQLNTVSRPPAEQFAFAVSKDQMERFRECFDGVVDVITESEAGESCASSASETTDADILALLSRRPCTLRDFSLATRLHPTEAAKRLDALCQAAKVTQVFRDGQRFYLAATLQPCRAEGENTK